MSRIITFLSAAALIFTYAVPTSAPCLSRSSVPDGYRLVEVAVADGMTVEVYREENDG